VEAAQECRVSFVCQLKHRDECDVVHYPRMWIPGLCRLRCS
jgi:hypothetical protein